MVSRLILLQCLLAAVPSINALITWSPCQLNGTLSTECANFTVPLDYTEPNSNTTLTLELTRAPASKNPAKGSILFNFGGPGENSRSYMAAIAAQLQVYTGGYYNLVTFDTRGTGNTLPFSCYRTEFERALASTKVILGNSSSTALGALWGNAKIFDNSCYAARNQTGGLVGTAFVARDMMRIVDGLDEDGLLRYWGFSYGSALGATVAAMFPDRMDRVILDGVLNPLDYYHGYDLEMYTDTDKVFSGMFTGCLAAPDRCALAKKNMTAAQLEEAVYGILETLKYDPIPFGQFLITYEYVKAYISRALYNPVLWPDLVIGLEALLSGNLTAATEYTASQTVTTTDADSIYGIKCGDKFPSTRKSYRADILPVIDAYAQKSRILGDLTTAIIMQCAQWEMDAKERYEGDFQAHTRHPLLLIGNTFDPYTPLVSAHNVSSGFEGSVVLEQHGYGHSSLAQPSLCTAKVVQEYFVNGTLPVPGTVCKVDVELYSNKTWVDVFSGMN